MIIGQVAVQTVLVGLSSTAQAVAPANAVLEVEVSVTIGGAVLEQESPSFSAVKVNLIPSEPTVTGTGAVAFEGDSATLTYTITTTANGFDTYTLTPALGTLDGVTGTPSLALSQNSVGLGATAVLSVSGAEVTVPFDGNADNAINGIVPGQNVVIGGQALTVVGITDTAETSKIQLSEPLGSTPQGTLIAESRSVTVTIADVGSLADTATPGSIPVTLSVRSEAGETSWDGLGEALVMVEAVVSASVELYARYLDGRVPTASSTGGEVLTLTYPEDAGQTYYKSGSVELSAAPEATVEYLMVFNAGSAEREDVVLRASTSSFLEYVPGSAKLNNNGLDDRQGSCDIDYWCTDDNSLAVGTVGANDTYYAVFQMRVSDGAVSSSASAASTSSSSTTSASADDRSTPRIDGDWCLANTDAATMRRPDKGWIEGKCRGRQDVCNGPNGVLSAAYGQAGSVTSHSAWLSKFARSGFLCETDTISGTLYNTQFTDGDCLFIKDSGDCADGTPWVDVPEHERTTFHACWDGNLDGGRWVVGESTGFGYEVQSHRLAGLRNRIKYCANLNLGMRDTYRRVRQGAGLTHLRETAVYCR